jgi:hypothetical protein
MNSPACLILRLDRADHLPAPAGLTLAPQLAHGGWGASYFGGRSRAGVECRELLGGGQAPRVLSSLIRAGETLSTLVALLLL